MPLNMQVHKYETRGGKHILTKITPYIQLKHNNIGPIFLQKGRVYNAGGTKCDPVPDWVFTEMEDINKDYLEKLGFTDERIESLRGRTLPDEPPMPEEGLTEDERVEIPRRLLTSEEASDMDFPALRAYAKEHGVKGTSKAGLIRGLIDEGWVV